MPGLPPQALGTNGGLYPVISPLADPQICSPPANITGSSGGSTAAVGGSNQGETTGVVQKGMTTMRIISRVAIGLRILRVAVKAARLAKSLLSREKPVVLDGHERGLHAVSLGQVHGDTVRVTACDDCYARLRDPSGLLRSLKRNAGAQGPWWMRLLGVS